MHSVMVKDIDRRPIVLSGMMGSGKSTVAKVVANRLNRHFFDVDDMIEAKTGLSVSQWFETHGEAKFRDIEAATIRELLDQSDPKVVALGGGAVLAEETRRRLLDKALLVTLDAPAEELTRRVRGSGHRPLLASGDTAKTLANLVEQRAQVYAECHARVRTLDRDIDDIAQEIERLAGLRCVAVPLGGRTYSVWIGVDLDLTLEGFIKPIGAGRTGLMVTDSNVASVGGLDCLKQCQGAVQRVVNVVLPAGEVHKTLANVERIWDAALEAGITRSDLVLGIGGGVVGDLAGFAAATLLRGVNLCHLPTTLLSMVDSSVGGKTGFDRPQGKNLVGAFYQPRVVICDLRWLRTLPAEELRSGMAEVVKAAWIAGSADVEFLEAQAQSLLAKDEHALAQAVHMAVALKAKVVASDERESAQRMLLNLGHTVGHAIEALQDFQGMRHGEAVALGMVASAAVGEKLGIGHRNNTQRLVGLLQRFGLPTEVAPWLRETELYRFLASDKKRSAQALSYVVAGAPGNVQTIPLSLEKLQKLLQS